MFNFKVILVIIAIVIIFIKPLNRYFEIENWSDFKTFYGYLSWMSLCAIMISII